jgi:hypothetical protein
LSDVVEVYAEAEDGMLKANHLDHVSVFDTQPVWLSWVSNNEPFGLLLICRPDIWLDRH